MSSEIPLATLGSDATPEETIDAETRRAVHLRRHHRFILSGALIALIGSFLFEVVPGGRIAVRGFESWPMPHTCLARRFTNHGCPGCGLTRGFIHLANARWQASLEVNRLAWLVALAAFLQIPYRLWAICGRDPLPLGKTWPNALGFGLAVLLVANWIYGLVLELV